MITLLETLDYLMISEFKFSPPGDALMNVLSTPSLQPGEGSINSEDFLTNESRADNGYAPEEYKLAHFNIN